MSDRLGVLQRIRDPSSRPRARSGASCDMCSEPIDHEHRHVVDVEARGLLCSCRGCYLLFTSQGAGGGHFRPVPDRYAQLRDLEMTTGEWDSLQIPVSIAFFFVNSSLGRVAAFYPGPAGATESELGLDTWGEIAERSADLQSLVPDVEAFLVRARKTGEAPECFIVPIDVCYELVGHLRRLWRGFDGGREAHDAIDRFFERVRARAR